MPGHARDETGTGRYRSPARTRKTAKIESLEDLNRAVLELKAINFIPDMTNSYRSGGKPSAPHGISKIAQEDEVEEADYNEQADARDRQISPRHFVGYRNPSGVQTTWTETEKRCFWLNIYHVLFLHGVATFGKPLTQK